MQMGPMLNDVLSDRMLFGVTLAGIEAAVEIDSYEEDTKHITANNSIADDGWLC